MFAGGFVSAGGLAVGGGDGCGGGDSWVRVAMRYSWGEYQDMHEGKSSQRFFWYFKQIKCLKSLSGVKASCSDVLPSEVHVHSLIPASLSASMGAPALYFLRTTKAGYLNFSFRLRH